MLRGIVLRSPHAHANIRGIDASKALALPGVKAVVTGADLVPPGKTLADVPDLASNLMATTKVYYRGQAVAAVAATSEEIAREAARLIAVDYEVLPAVLDVREAMLPNAPILHAGLRTRGGDPNAQTNIIAHHVMAVGDADAAMAGADVVTVEGEFKTSMVHQGYIEPHASTATWNPDGQITIWTSTQGSFPARQNTSAVLGHPISRIKVIPTEIGGGFGGKIAIYLEPVAALLARKSGKPVKVQMDRADVFEATGPTPGTSIRAKLGATKSPHSTTRMPASASRPFAAVATLAERLGGQGGEQVFRALRLVDGRELHQPVGVRVRRGRPLAHDRPVGRRSTRRQQADLAGVRQADRRTPARRRRERDVAGHSTHRDEVHFP